jgi:rare lipoprotein A
MAGRLMMGWRRGFELSAFSSQGLPAQAQAVALPSRANHRVTKNSAVRARLLLAAGLVSLGVAGCGHRAQTAQLPPQSLPPDAQQQPNEQQPAQTENPAEAANVPPPAKPSPGRIAPTPLPRGGVSAEDLDYVANHKPIYSQVGFATWYTAPYKGRREANGEVFDDRALTAAHRTLPMGTLIVVTNLQTGQSAAMRIADRGPFVEDRILDLTPASAKATGIYRVGMAKVRLDVYRAPKSIGMGGRWCVQIGAFHSERAANKLKKQLEKKYSGANVIEFPGEHSYWVRIRPEGDNRDQAVYIASHIRPSEGDAYLTRLD